MDSLAPGLLIATPSLRDPAFEQSVILLAAHGEDGSLGFILNRTTDADLARVARDLKLDCDLRLARTPVRMGGPVSQERGWVLFRHEPADDATIEIADDLHVSSALHTLERLLGGSSPHDIRFFIGYAGWGPMQLEAEIRQGSWLPVGLDRDLIFDTPTDRLWDEAMRRTGLVPGEFSMVSAVVEN